MTAPPDERSDRTMSAQPERTCCPVVELRQYTVHPGKRDILIDLFDRELIESQEAAGMRVIGQFRDLDDPNRFVWLRSFRDMPSRRDALKEFYGGPVWAAHRDAANATMIAWDDVLLLRPARPTSGFSLRDSGRPPPGTTEASQGRVVATIYPLDAPADGDFVAFFEHTVMPAVTDAGASIVAYLVTESSPNTYPALPVREGEQVFVWFARFSDASAYERHVAALARSRDWSGEISEALARRLSGRPQVLKLSPSPRSQLHG